MAETRGAELMAERSKDLKPPTEAEYLSWLLQAFRREPGVREGFAYYDSVTTSLKAQVESSDLWLELQDRLPNYEAAYYVRTKMGLSASPHSGAVSVKPWKSFVSKAFRINILNNPNFPGPPEPGWLLPASYFETVKDVIRTTFVVRYLDGIQELVGRIAELAEELGVSSAEKYVSTPAGYYGGHCVVRIPVVITSTSWVRRAAQVPVEIQVTTQVKEVLKELLHKNYEQQRLLDEDDLAWQWEYQGRPFAANYLGHNLHYVEGRIMNVRVADDAGSVDG
jgi:ppGpp synthetase/RelA/SpoT-type nucleotidyltranferase